MLAKRLADENFTVLLLEAGSPPPPMLDVPLLSKFTTNISRIHYLFESTPQKYAGVNGERVSVNNAKGVGYRKFLVSTSSACIQTCVLKICR